MNKFAKTAFSGFFIIFSFIFLHYQTAAQTSFNESSAEKLNALAGGSIGGAWQLNGAESDDPVQKMQELIQNKTNSQSAVETTNVKQLPPLTTSIFHPESMILADAANGEITINENFKDIVQTRAFIMDGKTRTFELSPGANYTVNASRADGKLVIETISPRGNRMIETFETAAGGKKLKISMRVETTEVKELITIHRTYDRTAIDIFSGDSDEME